MNKQNIYDELLSEKTNEADIKIIVDLFIMLQEKKLQISLKDIMSIYKKSINFKLFKDIITEAIDNETDIPIDTLKNTKLTGSQYLSFTKAVISAKQKKIKIEISDIEHFTKKRIDAIEVLNHIHELQKHEAGITIKDFINCENCMYHNQQSIKWLIELKKMSSDVSLKNLIHVKFKEDEIAKTLALYKRLSIYNKYLNIKDIITLKLQGIDQINFLSALILCEKNDLEFDIKHLINISKKEYDLKAVISNTCTVENITVKPIKVILKSGTTLLLKINYNLTASPIDFVKGMKKPKIKEVIKRQIHHEAMNYQSIKELLENSSAICEKTEQKINSEKPAYQIKSLVIQDFIIENNVIPHETQIQADMEKRKIAKMEFQKEHSKHHHKTSSHHD